MGNIIQTFTNDVFGTIRTITTDGQMLFCGKDVATALGYVNASKAVQDHYKRVLFRYPLETAGGIQQVRFITEGNLYRLIISSKLPAAQKFEAWVFATAIPTKHETSSTAKPTSANSSSRLRKPKDSTRTA
ncbi:hypothetical protein FRC0036_02193 [Corynebacterium diphtheriae]|uniref:Bro-N domain-containing protein n=5 Tax=Corynebacterium diphtheriae TaxID=1717 RepID=A0AAX0IZN0_CORDP|nr:Bro-N domain-containing protein [Corynebacterium diphtheriae]ERA50122.1 hypothetical protein B178_09656 [Corynebacterium diphtheriae DSM 43988]AEX68319.1 hypothetical protein CDC7B_2133 [Corynebacterium diphtheriae C7 (beta)]AEX70758.1 hypothetical protein CDPW8_2115 [Corynebacterium diphtheriae PW8]AEX77527.1 hypothetical protein CDHC02_2040 [Corynebacterium diphtheriae HC02]MBG9228206.1 Bro-N domain-containing protein [Corynebacterium diphtheriae bv. gravis]